MASLKEIKQRISDGTYPQGEWLPLLDEIASSLGASVIVTRQALGELERRRIVTNVKQAGWYAGTGARPAGPSPGEKKRWGWDTVKPEPQAPAAFLKQETYITATEFAAMLRVAKMTVYRIVRTGDIAGVVRVGRTYRIPVSGARKYLETSRASGSDDD